MSNNPYGTSSRSNMEWGRKFRKEEDRLRGTRKRGRRDAISEQMESNP